MLLYDKTRAQLNGIKYDGVSPAAWPDVCPFALDELLNEARSTGCERPFQTIRLSPGESPQHHLVRMLTVRIPLETWRLPLVAQPAMLISSVMKRSAPSSPFAFPLMMARLTVASWETIFHRSMMMAQGTCSAVEYQRMAAEKTAAAQRSMMALMTGGSPAAVMAPYVTRARANARRLRRKV